MLFMCHIDVSVPAEMPQDQKNELRQRENARAEQLIGEGVMVRIWRIVGRVANFSVWEAPTLEALHETLMSMPMFPYMKIEVTPLIDHPCTHIAEARNTRKP
ncbi:MAG TPA: muconolactone Delta-isomerase family protein [Ramlibacter sp.]|uniref:muconolactone Delta-isomerase n=1 Tax=Ramlibacter sp. TaxID=1917967 RepID=UPI002C208C1F|nr:muconolactone Delta-isomerase family protein [Ramlibacter sp.]HVZ45476.1 muconolactone Delta-isomerase family protein [Ramlibacter sp.]